MKEIPTPKRSRKAYCAPNLTVSTIITEYSIAAGSATVTPVNSSSTVEEEWETGADQSRDLVW